MTEQIAVVKPYYYTEQAYDKGYDRFADGDPVDDPFAGLDGFREGSTYANHVLPGLRSMAGYDDSGPGTWTVDREVAAIHRGCEEDEPATADLVHCERVFNALVKAWTDGALDALRGDERDPGENYW